MMQKIAPRDVASFQLPDDFVEAYAVQKPPFGFNGMGEFVYKRTYSRVKENGEHEEWYETVRRVVEGTFSMQKRHILKNGLGWKERKGMKHAMKMYDLIFNMKFLPPGRGLWAMGSEITEERGLFAALNNCAFVSTDNIANEPTKPYEFLMDMSMLGVGVGFDTKGAGQLAVVQPLHEGTWFEPKYGAITSDDNTIFFGERRQVLVISDDREGWVESLKALLESYFVPGRAPIWFDYSQIRPAGLKIKGFGGKSSGPGPLIELHHQLREILRDYAGKGLKVDSKLIVDIMNLIGKAVVAGNVRRTAEIVFGEYTDDTFINLKNEKVFPERNDWETGWGWTSNNSIFADLGMNYEVVAERTAERGEPGYAWLENMRKFGRMVSPANWKDARAKGGNPCLEQTLESFELCCLVDVNITNHESLEDYLETLRYAYMYAKTVTLGMTHWAETNRVMARNRRIGTSNTDVAKFQDTYGHQDLQDWFDTGYKYLEELDALYSEYFAVPRSIKMTSIKPSGSVSKVMGVWPGMHRPDFRFGIRRIRCAASSPLIPRVIAAGYHVEPSVNDPANTYVVEFPIDYGEGRTNKEVSIWEQTAFAAFIQKWWADNQVSCTVSFDPETEGSQIQHVLDRFQSELKGISFLPRIDGGAYPQMPEEEISETRYNDLVAKLKPLDFTGIQEIDTEIERGCDGDTCTI